MKLCIFLFFASFALNCRADDLVSVVTLSRHGDRSPKESFPKDVYFDLKYWPMGFSQLTNIGKNRQFQLGKWLRTRYDSLLPRKYVPEDIYARSTDGDRTLMSAYLILAGLYHPMGDQVWNPNIQWQPIPVHTIPREIDDIITDKRECKKYDKALKKAKKDDYYDRINDKHAELYNYLSQHTGWKVHDINKVKKIRSTFQSYESYNTSFIPEWARSLDNAEMDHLAGLAFQRYTYTEKMKRLRTGPFFHNLFKHFDRVIENDKDDPAVKFYMMSAHETTVAPVLDSMQVYDLRPPEFGATVIWELWQSGKSYYVKVFYKTASGLKQLTLPDCDTDCRYKEFKKLMEPITVDLKKWVDECD